MNLVWIYRFQQYKIKIKIELKFFFKILIGLISFFYWLNFFSYLLFNFLNLINLLVFFSPDRIRK
jgi:hypothetical protein